MPKEEYLEIRIPAEEEGNEYSILHTFTKEKMFVDYHKIYSQKEMSFIYGHSVPYENSGFTSDAV